MDKDDRKFLNAWVKDMTTLKEKEEDFWEKSCEICGAKRKECCC